MGEKDKEQLISQLNKFMKGSKIGLLRQVLEAFNKNRKGSAVTTEGGILYYSFCLDGAKNQSALIKDYFGKSIGWI